MIQECTELEENLVKRMFSNRDLSLISMMLGVSLSKEEAACLTENMDIDTESSLYMLSLGIAGFRFGWDGFPSWAVPRLKGLHRYYQVSASAGGPWLQKRLERLTEAGIPFMLTGALAMRAFYAADVPRLTYGYEVTVRSDVYERAIMLLRDDVRGMGTGFCDRTVKGHTEILMHKGVPVKGLFSEDEFWIQAHTVNFMGQNALVPGPEDMLLSLLCEPYGPQLVREKREERDRRLYEAGFVLQAGEMDYKLLSEKAKACGQEAQVRFFLQLLGRRAPKVVSADQWAPYLSMDKAYVKFLRYVACLDEIIKQREKQSESSLWQSFLQIRAEYRVVLPVKKARREKTGILPYIINTRNVRRFSDYFYRRKPGKDVKHEQS